MKERDKVTAAFMIKTFIETRFSEIEGFRDFLSSAIAREKNLIEERVAKQRQNMSDEELEIYLRVGKTYSIAKYVFPEMGIKSFI